MVKDLDLPENAVHAEYNVWTVPDCFGTSNETPNRTWFYFSIRGGEYYENVKIHVKNLNRQAKLYSQGMTPVIKIGKNGHWHRVKEAPTYQNEEDNFVISFVHKVNNHSDTETFYAFTYPFTYKDCINMLNKFDEKYLKPQEEIDIIIKQINEAIPIQLMLPNIESLVQKQMTNLASYSSSTSCMNFDMLIRKELQNEIYYHRETLITSLEGRRVDLLTISSFHGIQESLEKRLDNLFPDKTRRCQSFRNKKVIFLSSRVHPGETPASFVLNGFLNLILDRKNPVSITLRRMYVFKIVPILNPDGVYHGYYRTDTLGQNLNRMYMDTQIEYHPSIYAVKKLIKFYQIGASSFSNICGIECDDSSNSIITTDRQKHNEYDIELEEEEEVVNISLGKLFKIDSESCSSTGSDNVDSTKETLLAKEILSNEINMRAGGDENSIKKLSNQLYSKKNSEVKLNKKSSIKLLTNAASNRNTDNKGKDSSIQTRAIAKKSITRKTESKISSTNNSCNSNNSSILPINKIIALNQSKGKIKQLKSSSMESSCATKNFVESPNNLFLYVDMHGHASKKGVFMYGNHFTNLGQAIECMLLPKLMTINSQHFHFDACNFSEKNMYKKEKRDGLSKEGSGRVTIYKMTGLVKCYTLECNYNCGKYVNVLPSRNNIYSKQTMNAMPPKYTPAIYEEVGRALGPSILDLTSSNSASRLPNSEYRTLKGVRSSLRYDVDKAHSSYNKSNTANVTSKISKRRSNITSTSNSTAPSINKETAKENKEVFNWDTGKDFSASSSSLNSTNPNAHLQQSKKQHKSSKLTSETSTLTLPTATAVTKVTISSSKLTTKAMKKPNSFKIRSTSLYGKKDSPSSIIKKKAKILVESSNSGSCATIVKKEHQQLLQKKSNKFSTNVPKKRAKVVLKSATSTGNSNVGNDNNSKTLSNTKVKQFQKSHHLKMQNQKLQNNNSNTLNICNTQIISTDETVFNNNNFQTKQMILAPSSNMLTYTTPPKASCVLLNESNIPTLSLNKYKMQINSIIEEEYPSEQRGKYFSHLQTEIIDKSNIFNDDVINKPPKNDIMKKSSSTDSGLCDIYKNSLYKTNSIQQLPTNLDNENSIDTIESTALIKPENFNINSNINNFTIPSSTTKGTSIFLFNKNNNDTNPPNSENDNDKIKTTIDNNDNINNNDNNNNNSSCSGNCSSSSSNEKNDHNITVNNTNNEHTCSTTSTENVCVKCSSSSSLQLTTKTRSKLKSKSESMLYKSRIMHKDVSKKINRSYLGTTLDNAKLIKKRIRGFDSITIKRKKNKIRNSRY